MSAFGDYLENVGLDQFLNVQAMPFVAVLLHLYTGDPLDDDSGPEVVGGSYVPQPVTFNAAVGGSTTNNVPVAFPEATALWGLVSHFAIKDGVGNQHYHGAFDTAKTIDSGDVAVIGTDDLTVSHD